MMERSLLALMRNSPIKAAPTATQICFFTWVLNINSPSTGTKTVYKEVIKPTFPAVVVKRAHCWMAAPVAMAVPEKKPPIR